MISKEKYEASIASVTEPVLRAALHAYPAYVCWREKHNKQTHYLIKTHGLHGGEALVTLLHGADSTVPGWAVQGVDPQTLVRCGCGKWREATEAEGQRGDRKAQAFHNMVHGPATGQS